MNSPFRYPGGKHYARKIILPYLPQHQAYIEPFAGGGSIFFAKPKTAHNWLNDADPELINVYLHIQNHVDALIAWLEGLPANKETHAYYKNDFQPQSKLDQAGRWYFLNRTSYSGIMTSPNCYFGYSPRHSMQPKNWPKRLRATSKKLRGIKLTNLDFADVVEQAPDDAFLFIDPPYLNAKSGLYCHAFTQADHDRLAGLLYQHRERVKFLLTYDDCAEIRTMYQWALAQDSQTWNYTIGRTDDQKKGKRSSSAGSRSKGHELFIANYVPTTQLSLLDWQDGCKV